jgi:hypothetical protein
MLCTSVKAKAGRLRRNRNTTGEFLEYKYQIVHGKDQRNQGFPGVIVLVEYSNLVQYVRIIWIRS